MEHSSFGLKLKTVAPDGTFTGILAAYNNVDLRRGQDPAWRIYPNARGDESSRCFGSMTLRLRSAPLSAVIQARA